MNRDTFYIGRGTPGDFALSISSFPVTRLENGIAIDVPMLSLDSGTPGPTLGLIAALHGGEQAGVEIIRRVMTSLDKTGFRGKIVAVPVANALAFGEKSRITPLDGIDVNRQFPGSTGSSFSENLAYQLMNEFVANCDFLIDYHCGNVFEMANYVLVRQRKDSGLATGADHVFVGASARGGIRDAAEDRGVHCVTVAIGSECGGNDEPWIVRAVTATYNLMKLWGLMDGKLDLPPRQYLFTEKTKLSCTSGGMYYTGDYAKPGSIVPKGALLARVVHPVTFVICEEIVAPYDKNLIIIQRRVNCSCEPGAPCFVIANYDSVTVVDN